MQTHQYRTREDVTGKVIKAERVSTKHLTVKQDTTTANTSPLRPLPAIHEGGHR